MANTRLLHYGVGYMTNANFTINGKIPTSHGAVPYIVIPFPASHKMAPMFRQYFPDFFFVFRH